MTTTYLITHYAGASRAIAALSAKQRRAKTGAARILLGHLIAAVEASS